jgi:glutathione S-transferase
MADIILHHYPQSPYSQKIRSFLGFKKLAWRSHVVPPVPPRPAVNILTGGNRRIPVLQIGADIICDSTMILRTIEWLHRIPPVSHAADALNHPIQRLWEPRQMIYLGPLRFRNREDFAGAFASEEEMKAFRADRAPFMAPATDISKGQEFAPSALAHVKVHAHWLDNLLSTSGPFLGGDVPSPADFSAFHGFWWLKPASAKAELLSPLDALWPWVDRMEALASAVTPTPISGEEVIAQAKAARPAIDLPNFPTPIDPKPGQRVSVTPDDYGKDPVTGEIVSIGLDHIILRRETPETGVLHVHFPRFGYRVVAA